MPATNEQVDQILAMAAGLEAMSEHPLAKAIVGYAKAKGIAPAQASGFRALTGAGVQAQVDGRIVYVGSPEFFETQLKSNSPTTAVLTCSLARV